MSDEFFGASAGRSSKNPTKPTARRRFSEDERAQRTHQYDDPQAWPDPQPRSRLTQRGKIVIVVAALVSAFLLGVASSDVCWTGDLPVPYGACPWSP